MSNAVLIFIAVGYVGYLLGKMRGYYHGADTALRFITGEVLFALKDDHEATAKVLNHLSHISSELDKLDV